MLLGSLNIPLIYMSLKLQKYVAYSKQVDGRLKQCHFGPLLMTLFNKTCESTYPTHYIDQFTGLKPT